MPNGKMKLPLEVLYHFRTDLKENVLAGPFDS